MIGKEDVQNEGENERHKNKMKKREKLRIWDPAWRNQMRIQILGDSNLIVNWMNGKWKINNPKFRMMVQKTQNMLDKTHLRPLGDHLDMFQHIYRDCNQEAKRLTHAAREKGATWNSYVMEEGARIEAVRSFFDTGVSTVCDAQIENKVGSSYVIQIAERIEEDTHTR